MNHSEAIETQAAERYVLGELDPAQQAAFEEHFFDCPLCAMAVRETAAFVDSGKAMVRKRFGSSRRPLLWLPAAAAAAVLCVFIGAQLAPKPPVMQVLNDTILTGESRGEEAKQIPAGTAQLVYVDVPRVAAATRYTVTLLSSRNAELVTDDLTREQVDDSPVGLLLQPLKRGKYHIVIHGVRPDGTRTVVTRVPLSVNSK